MWRCLLVGLAACGRLNFDPLATPGDAGDAGTDGPPGAITATFATTSSNQQTGLLSYTVTFPAVTRGALLVTVQLGSNCGTDANVPVVQAVSYAGVGMLQIETLVGTPCDATLTRSEQWLMIDPPAGAADVVVDLSGNADTLHSAAIVLAGVDQIDPVRTTATTSGDAMTGTLPITSAPGDLVISTAGQGDFIIAPGSAQQLLYIRNVDAQNTQNNTAASFQPGADAVDASWTFEDPDDFQIIATSFRP